MNSQREDEFIKASNTTLTNDGRARCEKCDFDSLTSEWVVLVVVVLLVAAFIASVVHPVGRERWAAIGMWLKAKEGAMISLNGKLGVLIQT